jgi:two-component system, chemotaxis family, protein-glutamate methylesterase/glutaminase
MEHINVLVVDDSAFMRRAITKILENEPEIRVIATARSGEEAVANVAKFNPDVVTMDVEMPGIGGLEAVRQIVAHQRVPIIMVSSLTSEGAETTFVALELGAVDFIAKPDAAYTNINEVARDLVAKIRTFARRGARPLAARDAVERATERETHQRVAAPERPALLSMYEPVYRNYECVAVGTSTGGPVALAHVIPRLPADFPLPILIVQHMPLGFTRPLADRLNAQSKVRVAEAANGMILEPGSALVIPSGRQPKLRRSMGEVEVRLVDDDGSSLHVPSVDILDEQVADVYGPLGVGVILTGMGRDGVKGLRKLKARGGYVIGQDEATCVVYGMPRAAAIAGLVDCVAPLDEIPHLLLELTNVSKS